MKYVKASIIFNFLFIFLFIMDRQNGMETKSPTNDKGKDSSKARKLIQQIKSCVYHLYLIKNPDNEYALHVTLDGSSRLLLRQAYISMSDPEWKNLFTPSSLDDPCFQ